MIKEHLLTRSYPWQVLLLAYALSSCAGSEFQSGSPLPEEEKGNSDDLVVEVQEEKEVTEQIDSLDTEASDSIAQNLEDELDTEVLGDMGPIEQLVEEEQEIEDLVDEESLLEVEQAVANEEDLEQEGMIEEVDLPIGQITGEQIFVVNGYYNNPNWGEMLIEINEDNEFRATYTYKMGTVTGVYDPDTGVVKAWWCEEGDRQKNSGLAEFVFVADENQSIDLEGRWVKGDRPKNWHEDWDLTLINHSDAPEHLYRFDRLELFCFGP